MLRKPKMLSSRRLVSVAIVAGLVIAGIAIGVLRSTPVEAECHQVENRLHYSGMCTLGEGNCRYAGC